MAVENGNGPWLYRHGDWLGSVRLVSLPSGSSRIWYDGAFGPYGENYAEQGEIDRTFTGQGQAVVNSGSYPLYDFLNRELHPVWGRWDSPDPAGPGAVNPANPQFWNRYAYALNNPTGLTDPLGLSAISDACTYHPTTYLSPCFNRGNYWNEEDCNLDGGAVSCAVAYGLAGIDAAVECPNDDCSPVNDNGALKEFYAFADGSSGYYLANQAPQQSTLVVLG
jgi:RHS repeat-associated protein